MKKVWILLAAALLSAQAALAQGGNWEIGLGVGSCLYDRVPGHSEIGFYSQASDINSTFRSPTILPTFLLSAGYDLAGAPVGFYAQFGWNQAFNQLKGGPSLLKESESILHFVPTARLYYIRHPRFRMYADFGVDIRYRRFTEIYKGDTCRDTDFNIKYHIAPLGFSFGDRWLVSFGLGFGYFWSYGNIGFGYRF